MIRFLSKHDFRLDDGTSKFVARGRPRTEFAIATCRYDETVESIYTVAEPSEGITY